MWEVIFKLSPHRRSFACSSIPRGLTSYGQQLGFVAALVVGWYSTACGQTVVRVVDVGAGLCCVSKTSDGHYFIFDAGNYADHGETAMTAIEHLIPFGSTIDLLVLSHCDADHIAAVPFICENYKVKEIWRDGFDSGTQIWARADQAIGEEVAQDGCDDGNLQEIEIEPGYVAQIGTTTVTFLCGFKDIPATWEPLSPGENRNARSVVVRMDVGSASMLFGGDTVGRHIGNPWNTCIAAEAALVANASSVPLDVDVVVAPHHGADNASSYPFVLATSPNYVIFSAGSKFHHLHYWSANRYISAGVPSSAMFRTDRGDNEGDPEWQVGSGNAADPAGDDDVEARLFASGDVQVSYVAPLGVLETRTFMRNGVATQAVVRSRSQQVAKWVENEALWTETYDHIEDHTIPTNVQGAPQPTGTGRAQLSHWGCQPQCRCCFTRRSCRPQRTHRERCCGTANW